MLDVGGSSAIHTFGAYFGLTVSLILSFKVKPLSKPHSNYYSNIFAMIGTFFLWMYWPSFNAGFFPTVPYERSIIVLNTVLSLVGSCIAVFICSGILRGKFNMEDILNASLAGGVIIGAPSAIFFNPASSLTVGLLGGGISTFGFYYLSAKL
jgi:ammonium transporter Rh